MKETLSRRSLIDWLGKATVLALGGEVLAACIGDELPHDGDGGLGDSGLDGGPGDSGGDGGGLGDSGGDGGGPGDSGGDGGLQNPWGFEPPEEEPVIYESWPVRTVDVQEIESILSTWRLEVDGMVERPLSLSFADLLRLERQDQVTDFHCVEGWSVLDVPWNGVHLSTLFESAGVQEAASYVTFHTIGGSYNESLPLDVALEPKTILSYGVAEHTLPLRHGFPTRLIIPRLLAYKSAKYVQRIELTDEPVEGFWVQRGYGYDAEVPASRLRVGKY